MNSNIVKPVGNVYSYLLLALACISALLYTGDHIYHLSFMWLALVLWVVSLVISRPKLAIRFDAITIASIGYIFWLVCSGLLHPVTDVWELYTYRLAVFPFVILASYYLLEKSNVRAVLFTLIIVGLFDSFVTLYQSFYLGISADGLFANRNNNAAYLYSLLLPLFSVLVLETTSIRTKAIIMAVAGIFLLCIFQISSRGAYTSLLIAATLLFAFALYKRKYTNLIHASLFIGFMVLVNSLITDVELRTGVSSHSRWLLWISALDMLKDADWYGIGNGMFHWIYPQYMDPDEKSLGLFVHNDYLQILLELGIVGLSLFVSILAIVFLQSRKMLVGTGVENSSATYIGMALAILSISIHSLVTFNFYIVIILLVLGLYVGLLLKHIRINVPAGIHEYAFELTAKGKSIVIAVMILITIPLMFKGYADGVLDDFLNKDLANGTVEEDYEIYANLSKLDPVRYVYPMSMAWTGMVKSAKSGHDERVSMFNKTISLINEAKRLNPYAPQIYLVEAQVLLGFGDINKKSLNLSAISPLRKALALNPKFLPARTMLVDRLKISGDVKEALAVLLEGLAYIHDYGHKKYYETGASLAQEIGDTYSYAMLMHLLELEDENNQREFDEMMDEYTKKTSKM